MIIRHPPGNALQKLGHLSSPQGYHDPVYDPDGGQGTASSSSITDPNAPAQNPGVLMLVALIVLVVLMFGDENG